MKSKSKTIKDSGRIYLDFSETFELNDGVLQITCEITSEVYIQKPQSYADNPNDYYGYTEIECSSYKVVGAMIFDEVENNYVFADWEDLLNNSDKIVKHHLKSKIDELVGKAVDKQLERY